MTATTAFTLNYFSKMFIPNIAEALFSRSGNKACPGRAVYDQAITYFAPFGLIVEEEIRFLQEEQEDGPMPYTLQEHGAAFDFIVANESLILEGAMKLQEFEAIDDLDGVTEEKRVRWSHKNILGLLDLKDLSEWKIAASVEEASHA